MKKQPTLNYKHFLPSQITAGNSVPITLVGAGGTGSLILNELARINHALRSLEHAGIDVTVYDPDSVSSANLGRQLFSPVDIGRNKAEVLCTRINRFFGNDWKAIPQRYPDPSPQPYGRNMEILISAVDSAQARIAIAESFKGNRPRPMLWMDAGNTATSGQVILGTVPRLYGHAEIKHPAHIDTLPTVLDLYPNIEEADKDAIQGPSCSLADALEKQDLMVNRWVSSLACQLLWTGFRKGYLTNHGGFINLNTLSVRPLPISPDVWARMGYKMKRKRKNKQTKEANSGYRISNN